jgi:hypothetical protein
MAGAGQISQLYSQLSAIHSIKSTKMKPVNATLRAVIIALLPFLAEAQTVVPLTPDHWEFNDHPERPGPKEHVQEEYLGQPSLRLRGTDATLKEVSFTNGIIEYDAAFPPDRGGIGIAFRLQDDKNSEWFYVRPHQSGNPDAVQYMPLTGGLDSWQLYHGEGYSAAVPLTHNQWMHFRLVVGGNQMEVYINDMAKPALFVPELKRPVRAGKLSLFGAAHFANFRYTPLDKPVLVSVAQPLPPAPAGTITAWQVSDAFPEKSLEEVLTLTPAHKKGRQWQTLSAEPTGLVNLATGPEWSEQANTTFARVVIVSDKAQTKKLRLGFSDRARVYLNDQVLYAGYDAFRSRDYRFLGTVGYWDEVYLPLRKGRNELWVAVSEEFGGWGIRAAFADPAGVKVEQP